MAELKITYLGETKTLKDWGRTLGISYNTLTQRRKTDPDQPLEQLFRKPIKPTDNPRQANGRYL